MGETPYLEEGLARGIVNRSALARQLQPAVEAALLKEVTVASLGMALKRLEEEIRSRPDSLLDVLESVADLSVRSNLHEYTFRRSPTIIEGLRKLLDELGEPTESFFTVTRGVHEITVIVSSQLASTVERLFTREDLIESLGSLAAVTVKLPLESLGMPGVHYTLLKQLAWYDLNVVEVVSTYSELTIVLDRKDVDRAFSVLMSFTGGRSLKPS